jgi:hypothetical protein
MAILILNENTAVGSSAAATTEDVDIGEIKSLPSFHGGKGLDACVGDENGHDRLCKLHFAL